MESGGGEEREDRQSDGYEDDDDGLAQRAALPVPDARARDGPPRTAEEYLLSVRAEATALPSVLSSSSHTPAPQVRAPVVPRASDIAQPAAGTAPPAAWARHQLTAVRSLQRAVAYRRAVAPTDTRAEHAAELLRTCWRVDAPPPRLADVARLDQVTLCGALEEADRVWRLPHVMQTREHAITFVRDGTAHARPLWLFAWMCALDEYVARTPTSRTHSRAFVLVQAQRTTLA